MAEQNYASTYRGIQFMAEVALQWLALDTEVRLLLEMSTFQIGVPGFQSKLCFPVQIPDKTYPGRQQ